MVFVPPVCWQHGRDSCCETGIDKKVQEETMKKKDVNTRGAEGEKRDATNRKIYDVNSEEARKILSKQKVQGYTNDFGYIEKANFLDLYIPVPKASTT